MIVKIIILICKNILVVKMFHLYLMSVIAALTSSIANGHIFKIMGGEETTIEEYPHQVCIQKYETNLIIRPKCGGSLIKQDIVLTAAHCMHLPFQKYIVKAGSKYLFSGGQSLAILHYVNHPKYDRASIDYDVSVIKLKGSFIWSPSIQGISLIPNDMNIEDETMATTTGWGIFDSSMQLSEILRKVEVPKLNQDHCKKLYKSLNDEVTSRMTCYGRSSGGIDACQGDSGGPLMVGKYLVGIVSWGKGCAVPEQPGVYTNLKHPEIRQFIFSNWS